jgi:hypothetical protein
MRQDWARLMTLTTICLLAAAPGCQEGNYRYHYSGTVYRPDGTTPVAGVRLLPLPASNGRSVPFPPNDPRIVVSGYDGRFQGEMAGWFAWPILWPGRPQECKADKVWIYLPSDVQGGKWAPVAVPVESFEKGTGLPCSGTIRDLRVVLPK